MRKLNNILVKVIMLLLFLHAVMGCLYLLGISTVVSIKLPKILLAAVTLHAILGTVATIASVKAGAKSGKWYLKLNAEFWIKRITGLAILLLLGLHMSIFTTAAGGHYFLAEFTFWKMASQVLFILVIFMHVAVSVRSMLIASGTIKFKERSIDWMVVLSVLALLFILTEIIYYVWWLV